MAIQKTTDSQRLAVECFRTFLASEVAPVVGAFHGRPIPQGTMREMTQGIAEFGLPGASIARVYGGMGLSVVTEAMLLEELCSVSSEIAHCVIGNMLAAGILADLPQEEQALRERYLPGLLAGRSFGGFYLHEADSLASGVEAGVSAWSTADGWVINGAHERVCNGHCSDFLIIGVRTEAGALCHVLAERERHGYASRVIDRATLSGQSNTRVSFNNVRLPASQSIWNGQGGPEQRASLLEKLDAGMALLSVGLMRTVLQACIVASQNAGGSDRPAASQPLVALRIAEMATRLDAARLMCFRAYSMIDSGTCCQMQACMARWLASETALKACQDALQLPGGKGLSAALGLERLLREAIVLPVPHGVTDVQKLSIAKLLTGISALG